MIEFSKDQEGSRFIQKHLLFSTNQEEKDDLFEEILPRILELVTDVFGNYVVQKLLDIGKRKQINKIAEAFRGSILELSLQVHPPPLSPS